MTSISKIFKVDSAPKNFDSSEMQGWRSSQEKKKDPKNVSLQAMQ